MDFIVLPVPEAERALAMARSAFPGFSEWQYVNEDDGEHCGFCAWGVRVLDEDSYLPREFYVTFETSGPEWRGHLSIGQHAHMFTSADFGDAYLVSAEGCATLAEAIVALLRGISSLFRGILDGGE